MVYTYYYSTYRDLPKNLAWLRYLPISSPTPIYWYFMLRVYCLCANILALCVLSVKMWHLCGECSAVYRKDASFSWAPPPSVVQCSLFKCKFFFYSCAHMLFWDLLVGLHYGLQRCQSCALSCMSRKEFTDWIATERSSYVTFHGTDPFPILLLAQLASNAAFCVELLYNLLGMVLAFFMSQVLYRS